MGKMVKEEEIDIGKADTKDPSQLLDKTLYHVLTDILSLELDDRHARWCHLLHAKDCDKWIRFEELNLSDFENMEYESNGDIIKFTEPDIDRFKRLNEFIQYLEEEDEFDSHDPDRWTRIMWKNWTKQTKQI